MLPVIGYDVPVSNAFNQGKPGLMQWLGVDTGGTFTDFVYFDGKSVRIHKVLSTPAAPEQAILQGIGELGLNTASLHLVHGSTVATNAVLEAKGVKTVYVTNTGFKDVLSIGRQARRELYNLMPAPIPQLIDPAHCLEVDCRIDANGKRLRSLTTLSIDELVANIEQIRPRAVAINLLFSFLDDSDEKKLQKKLRKTFPGLFVCCSSEVLAEYREYERGIASVLNAYVGPLMQGYLDRLASTLSEGSSDYSGSLSVMQSHGGTIDAAYAGQHAVGLLLSGPAGGLKAAQAIAEQTAQHRLMSFDMGGTSTDVALMDHGIRLTSEGSIGHLPVAIPMVDMHTIGAGGGSIAFVDEGGLLNVGPRSAGASPGPACYGAGGAEPTVTDANLLLGRLRADGFLGQGMQLDIDAAKAAMQPVAEKLGMELYETALGIIRIANEHMVRALRTISVQKGFDPKDFSLTCFGGAGGLHVCALADALAMQRAIVPVYSGVLSALGMLVSAPSRELSHSVLQPVDELQADELAQRFRRLVEQGEADMKDELVHGRATHHYSFDMRYIGQSFSLNIQLVEPDQLDIADIKLRFHQLHKQTYGHELDMPVELVNIRLGLEGVAPPFQLPEISQHAEAKPISEIECYAIDTPVAVYQRDQLASGQVITGPSLVLEKVSTTLVETGWSCHVDRVGNLLLQRH